MANDKFIEINPQGAGPFVLPLLTKLETVDILKDQDVSVLRFQFEDGAPIHVPISNRALDELYDYLGTLYHVHGGKLPGTDPTNH